MITKDVLIIVIGVLIFAIIILLMILYHYTFDKTYNKCLGYYVVAKYADKNRAAQLLQELNIFGIKLISEMHKKYNRNVEAMKIISHLMHNYNPDDLQENDPIYTLGHKAYTLNFRKVALCLRKNDGSFYDINLLQFVFLHELAHIGSLDKAHSENFWFIFKYILVCAKNLVNYFPTDYEHYPTKYCNINVQNNPYFSAEYNVSNLLSV